MVYQKDIVGLSPRILLVCHPLDWPTLLSNTAHFAEAQVPNNRRVEMRFPEFRRKARISRADCLAIEVKTPGALVRFDIELFTFPHWIFLFMESLIDSDFYTFPMDFPMDFPFCAWTSYDMFSHVARWKRHVAKSGTGHPDPMCAMSGGFPQCLPPCLMVSMVATW